MKLYQIGFDGEHEMVEAEGPEAALRLWRRWGLEQFGDDFDDDPESIVEIHGRPVIRSFSYDEERVRLLLSHGVSFSLDCGESDCNESNTRGGDQPETYDEAIKAGWRDIEPAPGDDALCHFYGTCPKCVAADHEKG